MAYWKVMIEVKAETELSLLLKKKVITKADIKVLLRWVSEMEEFGPEFISTSSEWHDHELEREWFGFRSSAFSNSGRIIYKIIEDQVIVQVVRVTAHHDYKK